MRNYTIQELKSKFKELNYIWDTFNIIGIRNINDKFDEFDDRIYIVWGTSIYSYSCTTNPGGYYLISKLLNPKGAAVLTLGQHYHSYQLGLHRGHPALIQAKPLTVIRDGNKNKTSGDSSVTQTGWFGINIHGTYLTYPVHKIFRWSAGCTVLNIPEEFNHFLGKCKQSRQQLFTYTLLNSF